MAERYVTCPLCGFEFEKLDTLCQHGCPLSAVCNLVRCPGCAYEFPETPRAVSWLQRLFTRSREPRLPAANGVATVGDLGRGERARVLCLAGRSPSRCNSLAVFGLVPGVEVTLIQRRPSCVVQVGETELALDPEIAREIVVERGAERPDLALVSGPE